MDKTRTVNLLKVLKYVSVDLFFVTLSLHNDREKKLKGQINKFDSSVLW